MKELPAYQWQPTTSEVAARAGIPESRVERFDQNTSPTPPSGVARAAETASARLNEYPAASYISLREAVASITNLDAGNVVPGAGVDELILLAARAFLEPGDVTVVVTPTYPVYSIATAQTRAYLRNISAVPPDFIFPAERFVKAAQQADLAWLCIPNNPTGTSPDNATIDAVLDAVPHVVVDAAYAEFAKDDWTDRVRRHPNLLVLHTMSKAYGLAGARVGYALGDPKTVAAIDAIRPPSSIGTISVGLALTALATQEQMLANVAELMAARAGLSGELSRLGLRVVDSPTNFVLCEVGPGAARIQNSLMLEGLVVRKFPAGGPLTNYLRFTVRGPEANVRLIEALERKIA